MRALVLTTVLALAGCDTAVEMTFSSPLAGEDIDTSCVNAIEVTIRGEGPFDEQVSCIEITPGRGKFPQSFQMGSADGPAAEKPRHEVTLKHSFSIAKYEVPQNLYEAVMGENPSRWKGPRNSAEMMTWRDAEEFCRKLSARLREAKLIAAEEDIRLPSEAEWEYCCRAGTETAYSFGDEARTIARDADVALLGPVDVDDRALAHARLARVFDGLGLPAAAAQHRGQAQVQWQQWRAQRTSIARLLDDALGSSRAGAVTTDTSEAAKSST